VELLVPRF